MKAAALIAIALLAPVRAGGEARPKYGHAIEGSLLGEPIALDPQAAQTHAEIAVVDLVFDALYRVDASGTARPHLAAGPPQLDAAGTAATIAIRKHVRFHDGAPLAPGDVAASLDRLRGKWPLAAVTAVRALPDAIELTLRAPAADLPLLLALPQTAVTRGGRPPAANALVGSGPFAIEAIDRANKLIRLRAFDDHFAGRPYLDRLELRWFTTTTDEARRFESGKSQISARGVGPFTTSVPKYRADAVEGPAALLVYVGFGTARGELTRSVEFRRAIDLALARDPLRLVTSGERIAPTREPVPVEAGGAALTAAARRGDLPAAQAALAAAARTVRALAPAARGQLGELEILIEDARPDDYKIANYVLYALHSLGIRAKITSLPARVFRARVAQGQADLWIGQLAMPILSARLWWGAAFAAGGDSVTGLDLASARQAFERRLPILPLAFRAVRLWHRTDVRGLVLDATGRPGFADVFVHGSPALSKARPP